MPASSDFPQVAKTDVFARLAEGVSAGVTVITPNRRLAQELAREFDADRIANGLHAWEAADILPFGSFVERLWESALYSDLAQQTPLLLSPAQEQTVWEEIIAASPWGGELMSPARAAAHCRDAWRLAHAWRIDGALEKFPGNDDARAFAQWARAYARRTAREADAARLPDAVAGLLGSGAVNKPRELVAYAFDILPPQTAHFLAACATHGVAVARCSPRRREATPVLATYPSECDERNELEAAACWARARLEKAHADAAGVAPYGPVSYPRIGVVVPDLERRRQEVARVFARVMEPGWNLPGAAPRPLPFNISIGVPLANYPLVHAALGVLALAAGEVDFALASRLVRSPFVGGAEGEHASRARLDAKLRESLPARVTLARLVGAIDGCPQLRERFESLYNHAAAQPAGARSPHEWARHFSVLLAAAGFPGERALDSNEFQTRAKWYEVLGEFASLERVAPRMTCAQALARLRRLAADTLFQPESADAPIQVLGILESAGLEFDCLWVSGLTDDAWPLAAHPNPFIPVALQKKAGIPEATADGALALDRRITDGWLHAAGEVVFSYPRREDDRELVPSPLLAPVREGVVDVPRFSRYRDVLNAARVVETVPDGVAPRYTAHDVRGGTRVLVDQAACPFRAFARHRLGAEGIATPADGLDARDRGKLVHTLLMELWGSLGSKSRLDSIAAAELAAVIDTAAATAVAKVRAERAGVLEGRMADLERARLAKLAHEWLAVERMREDFEVVAREERRTLEVAGLAFTGRIDRMDRLTGGTGGYALLDYKSGRASPNDWHGTRPDDPQLPLYAITAEEDIAAVAFAHIKAGEMRFMGLARQAGLMPKVDAAQGWSALCDGWRRELEALAREFAQGDARVNPKRLLETCRHCDLQPLCRVHERIAALDDDYGADE